MDNNFNQIDTIDNTPNQANETENKSNQIDKISNMVDQANKTKNKSNPINNVDQTNKTKNRSKPPAKKKRNVKTNNKKQKKTKSSNELADLIKTLINIETKQELYIKELLDIVKNGGTFVKNPLKETETKIANIGNLKKVLDLKLKKNNMTNVEREISLDIPSLRIKDKFKIEDKLENKIRKFENKKIKSFFGFKKNDDDKDLLKKMVTKNMKKLLQLNDDRKQIIGLSYILRQFLEIKFSIPQTLTYLEMITELKSRDINNDLKIKLIEFFSKLLEEIYKGDELTISVDESFELTNQTIQELGKQDKIKKELEKKQEILTQDSNKPDQKITESPQITTNNNTETAINTQKQQ